MKSEKVKRCYNCGASDEHESRDCPHKDKGPKCFACGDFGHKSGSQSCSKKDEKNGKKNDERVTTNVLVVPNRKRVNKKIELNGKTVIALFDTGSDINVMQKSFLERHNFGTLKKVDFSFDAIGASNKAIGYFEVKIVVDSAVFDDICFVIPDQDAIPDLIIGLTLINQAEMIVNANGILIKKIQPDSNQICTLNESEEEWKMQPMCALIAENQSHSK